MAAKTVPLGARLIFTEIKFYDIPSSSKIWDIPTERGQRDALKDYRVVEGCKRFWDFGGLGD